MSRQVVVTVQGARNTSRLTFPALLNDANLTKLAQEVARKAPGRVYEVVEVRATARTFVKLRTLYRWHVGDGFAHKDGWWVTVDDDE